MRDILPAEVELRDAAIAEILRVYRSYGFRRIETPALESLSLLAGSDAGENEKLIFKVLKRGEKLAQALGTPGAELADLGLRFDLTVPLARYYAENHARLPQPLKAIQVGPVWRAERPQRGRFRQFTQCDIDILGLGTPVAEIELIGATCEALLALGLGGLRVRLNDRRILAGIARYLGVEPARQASFFIAFDKLDKVGVEGVVAELRAGGHDEAAIARFQAFLHGWRPEGGLEALRALLGRLDPETADGFRWLADIQAVAREVAAGRYRVDFDPALVRGMGYYTGPVFEISHAAAPGSIAGGGRYDRMIGRIIDREVPASGFSIGFERLVAILQSPAFRQQRERLLAGSGLTGTRIAVLYEETGVSLPALVQAARELRKGNAVVSLEPKRRNMHRQLDELAAHGFSHYAVLRGDAAAPVVHPLERPGAAPEDAG